MGNGFENFRKPLFGFIALFSLITLGVTASMVHSPIGLIFHLAGFALFTAIATVIIALIILGTDGPEPAEMVLILFWIFWLAIGADATAVKHRLFSGGCGFANSEFTSSADCKKLGSIAAFGFMIWIMITSYFCALPCYTPDEAQLPTYVNTTSPIQLASPQNNLPTTPQRSTYTMSPKSTIRQSNIFSSSSSDEGTDPDFACLMCRTSRKNGRFDFCGIACRDEAKNSAPLLLEVPEGHTTFANVERKFRQSWSNALGTFCPSVRRVYRVVESSELVGYYNRYKSTHGNECFRYHGTKRSCQLGDYGSATLCASSFCNACSIIRTSFEVSLAAPSGSLGKGIYTSSASNKAAQYCDSTTSGVMFVTKVVLGKVHKVTRFAEVNSCPYGKQSVVFDRERGNETVVYTNNAIRPVFLIVFG